MFEGGGASLGFAHQNQTPRWRRTWSLPAEARQSTNNFMMGSRSRFKKNILTEIRNGKILPIRAGTKPHRIIGIWAVVVEGRVFVRSWSLKPRSWYRTFREDPRGVIEVAGTRIPVRAIFTRSERLKTAVDRAYREKYNTPGSLHFVKGFRVKKRRDTTTELVPLG